MYLPEISYSGVGFVGVLSSLRVHPLEGVPEGYEWFEGIMDWIGGSAVYTWSVMQHLAHSTYRFAKEFLLDPSGWAMDTLVGMYDFLHDHPHIVYLLSLSIFFGPIIVLIPFLLLQEVGLLLTFNLSFVTHGLIPGRVEDQYEALKEQCMESKEKVFASVEAVTAIFNEWTTEHPILMILRVLSGLLGIYVLYGLWTGKTSI